MSLRTLEPPAIEAPTTRRSFVDHLGLVLGGAGLALWFLAVQQSDYAKMSGYGLVTILPWSYFVGLTLVIVGFTVELMRPSLRNSRLLVLTIVLVVFLYGTASAVEPVAELTDSWIHTGFIQYILIHGQSLNGYDARFSWPGAFSMSAVLATFAGQANTIAFLKWFPLFIEVAYLAPLLVIARFSGVGRRTAWLGIAFYYATNWILQDYFSPQALNYLFYLTVIAAVMACWQPVRLVVTDVSPGSIRDRISRSRHLFTIARFEGHHAISSWNRRSSVTLIGVLSLIFLAMSMSHQLTPYALILSLVALLLTRRLGRPELIVLLVVLSFGWLSLGASNYWVGHLSTIFGGGGQLSNKFSANVTSRITGNSAHLLVVELRILLTGALFMMAGVGFLRRRADSRTLEALAGAPILLVAAQSYGGEGLLRVVLYGLPFTSLLAASALLPSARGEIRSLVPSIPVGWASRLVNSIVPYVIAVALLCAALATTVVRGGNDQYESFSSGELAAVNYVYNHIRQSQVIGVTNYFLPIGQRKIGVINEFIAGGSGSSDVRSLAKSLVKARPNYVILSKSEEAYGVQVDGYRPGWEVAIERVLIAHGYEVVAHWPTAIVLKATNSTSGSGSTAIAKLWT